MVICSGNSGQYYFDALPGQAVWCGRDNHSDRSYFPDSELYRLHRSFVQGVFQTGKDRVLYRSYDLYSHYIYDLRGILVLLQPYPI